MKNSLMVVAVLTVGFALSSEAATVEVKVDSGEEALSTRAELATLGTEDTLVKTGNGKLVITTELSGMSFAGAVIVSNGVVRLNAASAAGTGSFTVADGGAVEFGPTKNVKALNETQFYLNGTGSGSSGAVYANSSDQQSYIAQKTMTLQSDSLIKCVVAGLGPSGATVNLGGKKLTLDGGMFECRACKFNGPGEIVVNGNNTLFLENATSKDMGTTDVGQITVKDGGKLLVGGNALWAADLPKFSRWPVVFEGAGSWKTKSWTEGSYLGWNGPVTLGDAVTFDQDNANVFSNILTGVVSGDGGIVKKGIRTVVMSNPANAVKGDVSVQAGTLDYAGSVGGNVTVSGGSATLAGPVGGNLMVSGASTVSVAGVVTGQVSVTSANAKVTVGGAKGGVSGVAGAKLVLDCSNDPALTDSILYGHWRSYTDDSVTENTANSFFDFSVVTPDPYTFAKTLDDGIIVSHAGPGVLTVTSSMTDTPAFKNLGGELVLAPTTPQEAGWIDVRLGTLTIAAGSVVKHPTNNVTVAAAYPDVARLAIKGTLTTDDHRIGIDLARNAVTRPTQTVRGICEIFDGAAVTNLYKPNISVGYVRGQTSGLGGNASTMVSWYQHGGDASLVGNAEAGTNTHYVPGSDVCLYYSLEGGTYSHGDARDVRFCMGNGTYAVFAQSGGTNTLQDNAGLILGGGDAKTVYYLSGGRLESVKTASANIIAGKENWERDYNFGGSRTYITVDGENAVVNLENWSGYESVSLCRQVSARAEVNVLNGATFGSTGIDKAVRGTVRRTPTGSGVTENFTNTSVVVNFDGGTFKLNDARSTVAGSNFAFSNFVDGVDHVFVHQGGMTVDTDLSSSLERLMGSALEAPTGNGVQSVSLTAEVEALPAWEFTGAPWVEIIDPNGSGTGASAVAIFDTTTGKLTGIRVMNPGSGYSSSGVIATLSRGGSPNTYELPCTVAANVSGGLTKKGAGTLVLDRPCTYTGKTTLAGGTLKFGVDEAVRAESRFVLAGGLLDMDGKTLSGGATAVTDWGADVAYARANGVAAYENLSFPAGSTLTVDGADTLPADGVEPELRKVVLISVAGTLENPPAPVLSSPVTKGWNISWNGNKLRALRERGTLLILR